MPTGVAYVLPELKKDADANFDANFKQQLVKNTKKSFIAITI